MKCKYCSKGSVYYRRISNEYVCQEHFIITIERKIRKTVRKFNQFNPQEKVVVGVSGGKDSLVALWNTLLLQKRNPQSPPVEAILIDEGIKGYRAESTQIAVDICKQWGVPLHIVSFEKGFGSDLDSLIPKLHEIKMNACTICGTVRRRLLNQKSLEIKADKLVIGHNLDDQGQTFLANIVRNDMKKIGQSPPFGNPKDEKGHFVPRVKPLMYIPENEIVLYCYYKKIPIQSTPCPYIEGFPILRKEIQDFINNLDKNSPEIKYNLLKMNNDLYQILNKNDRSLKENHVHSKDLDSISLQKSQTYNLCEVCGEPCGIQRKKCYYCELKELVF